MPILDIKMKNPYQRKAASRQSTAAYDPKKIYKTFDNELSELQSATSVPKLYALSENGPLPDITKLAQQNGIWSWFCTWNGEFVINSNEEFSEEYTDLNHFKTFYDNPFVITKDELPQF